MRDRTGADAPWVGTACHLSLRSTGAVLWRMRRRVNFPEGLRRRIFQLYNFAASVSLVPRMKLLLGFYQARAPPDPKTILQN